VRPPRQNNPRHPAMYPSVQPDNDEDSDRTRFSRAEQLDCWTAGLLGAGEVDKGQKARGWQQRRYLLETRGWPNTLVCPDSASVVGAALLWFSSCAASSVWGVCLKPLLLPCSLYPKVSSVNVPFAFPLFPRPFPFVAGKRCRCDDR
jgi:hypothetical protein